MGQDRSRRTTVDRRTVIRGALGLAAAGGVLGLSACGGDDGSDTVPTPTATTGSVASPTTTPAIVSTPLAAYQDPERWRGRTLTVASPGGAYQAAQETAFILPFQEATGARITVEVVDVGRITQQVDRGETVWDLCCIPTENVIQLGRDGYLTPIDYAVVDSTALFEDMRMAIAMQHGVIVDLYSTTIAYAAAASEVPESWTDFWDVSRFGGLRTLRRSPVGTLEFALLADGVAVEDLYPLDADRAFAALERIYPSVITWYEDAQLPVQYVLGGQVGLSSAWNVRIDAADVEGQVRAQWNGGMLSGDSWVVPMGARNADLAMDFINYSTRSVPQANFCNILPFGPVNARALEFIAPDRIGRCPTSDALRPVQFLENWNYWTDEREGLTERFEAFLTQGRPDATPIATPVPLQ
jgi:putative spermidine/putrescine transport system substrate-binding protein